MKSNFLSLAISACIMLSTTSCIHYYYAPSSNNVPLFKEKNEMRIQAQHSTVGVGADLEDAIDGFEIQTAYAVGNHTAVQVNFLHAARNEEDYGSGDGNYIEAAAGYFKPSVNKHWIFETYAGLGTGSVNSTYGGDYSSQTAKTSVTKFFAQPSFGYSSDYFAMAFSSKFSLVNFGVSSSSLSKDNSPTDYEYIESFRKDKSYFWWEPGIMIRAGFKEVQAITQITYSMQGNDGLPFCNMNYSIGIILPFNTKPK